MTATECVVESVVHSVAFNHSKVLPVVQGQEVETITGQKESHYCCKHTHEFTANRVLSSERSVLLFSR